MTRYAPRLVRKTAAPTVNDDKDFGFVIGDIWLDTTNHNCYIAETVANGAAVWNNLSTGGGGAPTQLQVVTALYHRAAANPTAANDTYEVGALWVNTATLAMFRCDDNTATAAVWTAVGTSSLAVVRARATSGGQSIPTSTDTVVDFSTVDYDSDSAITTGAAWKFTAPRTGYYHVDAAIIYDSASFATAVDYKILIKLNGTVYSGFLDETDATNTRYLSLQWTETMYLTAGDYIQISTVQGTAGARSLAAGAANYNRIIITST